MPTSPGWRIARVSALRYRVLIFIGVLGLNAGFVVLRKGELGYLFNAFLEFLSWVDRFHSRRAISQAGWITSLPLYHLVKINLVPLSKKLLNYLVHWLFW
jgi:hypothetical protein